MLAHAMLQCKMRRLRLQFGEDVLQVAILYLVVVLRRSSLVIAVGVSNLVHGANY
jgi:hypothetical protein